MKTIVEYQGKRYVWAGVSWYGEKDFLNPPISIVHKLNALIEDSLNMDDESITDPRELCRLASELRDSGGQLKRALRLAHKANEMMSNDAGVASVLSSVLRAANRPSEAIAVTEKFAHEGCCSLLTSRAAALCDLGQWSEALKRVKRVFAITKGCSDVEALNVWCRIKANAPQLLVQSPD